MEDVQVFKIVTPHTYIQASELEQDFIPYLFPVFMDSLLQDGYKLSHEDYIVNSGVLDVITDDYEDTDIITIMNSLPRIIDVCLGIWYSLPSGIECRISHMDIQLDPSYSFIYAYPFDNANEVN